MVILGRVASNEGFINKLKNGLYQKFFVVLSFLWFIFMAFQCYVYPILTWHSTKLLF